MQSFVKIGDREAVVETVSIGEDKVRVTVDEERTYEVDLSPDGSGAAFSLLIDGSQYEVFAYPAGSRSGTQTFRLSVNGHEVEADVADPLAHLASEAGGVGGSAQVSAYMPGRVVALLVEQGATVEQGQGVLVLEAMKMENEIAAEAAGVVSEFFVEEGQAVEAGDPLFEVTAAED